MAPTPEETAEEIRVAASELDELVTWARNENSSVPVEMKEDEYALDLGQFGMQYIEVELSTDNYEICPIAVLDNGPTSISRIDELVGQFNELADRVDEMTNVEPETLDGMLDRLRTGGTEDEQRLATVLWTVVYAMRDAAKSGASPTPSLPASPLPWPGALQPDIDYTADDFPQRYQPPPGFCWSDASSRIYTDPNTAVRIEASAIGGGSGMVLDDKGRVRYRKAADGDYGSGDRWFVWHNEREQDGRKIPAGAGFGLDSPPRAIDPHGAVLSEPHTEGTGYDDPDYNWRETNATTAYAVMGEIQGETPHVEGAAEGPPPAGGAPEFAPPEEVRL